MKAIYVYFKIILIIICRNSLNNRIYNKSINRYIISKLYLINNWFIKDYYPI